MRALTSVSSLDSFDIVLIVGLMSTAISIAVMASLAVLGV